MATNSTRNLDTIALVQNFKTGNNFMVKSDFMIKSVYFNLFQMLNHLQFTFQDIYLDPFLLYLTLKISHSILIGHLFF